MFLSVGDILQLTRLAADLYTKGWVVARDAPQEFRDLVHELLLLKDILFTVHRKVTRDEDGLYGDPTKRVLQQCFGALKEFSVLVAKYEQLALSDKGHWFRRLQWSREQDGIRACRNKLQKHQQLLHLVLTPEGRTILSEEATDYPADDGPVTFANPLSPYLEAQITSRDRSGGTSFTQPFRTQTLDSAQTLVPSHNSPPPRARESFSQTRQRPSRPYLNADAFDLPPLQRSPSQFTEHSSLSDGQRSGEYSQPAKLLPHRGSDATFQGRLRQLSVDTIASNGSFRAETSDSTVFQPLEIPEQREKHECPEELKVAFVQSFDALGNEVLDESWLRVATWWLIKSQKIFRTLNSNAHHQERDTFHDYSHWENTTSADQAYVDLLKASWTLDELIRERKVAGDLTKSHTRKLAIDLMKALQSDLHHRQRNRSLGRIPATSTLLEQDLSLLESFEQTVEAKENEPRAMDDLTTSQRWITIDKGHGGFPDEHILFRSFVNAQIGQRHERSKSSNAPYVILLWIKAGESEITVSLCNQRDTMNLSRKLTSEDLEHDRGDVDAAHRGNDATALHLEFPSQSAEINFLTASDFNEFCEGPKRFFDAVKGRDPRPGELTVFSTVLKSYRNVSASATPANASRGGPAHNSFGSCELRLYEQMDETCWKSIRRLVVSSAADSKKLGSVSHWLPISNVKLQVEDSTVTISWSDCAQLEKQKGEGNYNPYYSFVYRSDTPNQKVILHFNHADDAQKFEDCILYLTETPPQVRLVSKIGSASAFQETRIYSLYDQDDPDRGYHGPKDTDALPEFREVTRISRPVQLSFSADDDATQFLSGLTGWRLKFYKQCAKLVAADTSRWPNPKKTYKKAEISLWEKSASEAGSVTQLLVRVPEMDKPWVTARLETSGDLGLRTGGIAELKRLAIQQGKDLDTKYMQANSEEVSSRPCWKFTITFQVPSGKEHPRTQRPTS
ncbi:MAG: hypothetical protein Q9168_001132 [Polycauliona sp. 1 TL-2023]